MKAKENTAMMRSDKSVRGLWVEEFPAGITVCDKHGIIIEMNRKAQKIFDKYGGKRLIGKNALDCHPEPARAKLKRMLKSGAVNAYTIEKKEERKLIWQGPWHKNGRVKGIVELSMEIPKKLPHFIRK